MTSFPVLAFDFDETIVNSDIEFYSHIPALLKHLKQQGFRLWLVSFNNKAKSLLYDLSPEIYDLFDDMICPDYDITRKANKGEFITKLCKKSNGVTIQNVILFDDLISNIADVCESGGQAHLVHALTGVTEQDIFNALSAYVLTEMTNINYATNTLMFIAVGSTQDAKIEAVKRVFVNWQVTGHKVDSKVSDQPIGQEETVQGAKNRALDVRQLFPNACAWIGIENGLVEYSGGIWVDQAFVVLIWNDRKDNDSIENLCFTVVGSAGIPTSFQGMDDLKRYQTEIAQKNNNVVRMFTSGYIGRTEVIEQAVKIARFSQVQFQA